MSILIKGIEMPKNCAVCPFFVRSDSPKYPFVDCKLIGRLGSVFNAASGIPVDCHLVPVPPHGRLIDADALTKKIKQDGIRSDPFVKIVCDYFKDAPTTIPAEEGEK